ncbi:MAG: hypothetical protein IMF16_08100, partial [Proteobacteria bacterium]|nr:hypothetical protein [Pseudomonadota bacterium]
MHGISRSRSLVAAAIIMAMAASITGLFGASGPAVRITSPASGAQVNGVIQVRASVSGSSSASYVIFGVDNTRPYSSNSMPYTFSLDTRGLSDGAHRIFAEVYDNYGLAASSNVVTIRVSNGLSSAVQARSEPATRVAERPIATPPARVAANAEAATEASTASSTQESERAATSSPTVAVRGPLPEPTRTTAPSEVPPATGSEVDAPAFASLPAAPTSTRPPVV